MKAQIKFIRHYAMYREDWFEVIYQSGRIVTYRIVDLPSTVQKYLDECPEPTKCYDPVFKRDEFIYQK